MIPPLTKQEHRAIGNIPYRARSAQRDLLRRRRGILGPRQTRQALGAGDGAGGDDVRGDAVRAELDGGVCGEGVDGGFGGADVGLQGDAGVVQGRRDEDDAAGWEGEGY